MDGLSLQAKRIWFEGTTIPSELYWQDNVHGQYWDGNILRYNITGPVSSDFLETLRTAGYPPENMEDVKNLCSKHGGHVKLRYLADVCEGRSIVEI